ncbi:MAG: DUF1552 domain-containing protein [Myxococcales bacterium]|nr:DUF1552 domain-containing protein [Myxococcales bacterium]
MKLPRIFSIGKKAQLSRRTMLRGVIGGAGVGLALPLLDAMVDDDATRLANGAELPRRFGVFYWGGGVVHDTWVPTSTGMTWDLPDSLTPFEAIRDSVTLITGTEHKNSSPGHIPARGIALSSSHDMTICTGDCVGTYRGQDHPQPSIDSLVAEAWDGQTPYKSLEVSICQKGPYKNNSSWKAGGTTYNRHEPSPQAVFERLFGDTFSSDPGLLETTTELELSMLDAVMNDAKRLGTKVSYEDRMRLEQHLEGLRSIEQRLQNLGGLSCQAPDAPVASDFGDGSANEQKQAKSELQSQLVAAALACDLTRVFSYEWSATQSEAVYWEVGSSQEHHQLNHDAPDGPEMRAIVKFIMQNFAYLAMQIAAYSEPGGGSLLDQTLIFGTSEHARAGSHNYTDHPMIFVGKAGGSLKAGMHHRVEGSNLDGPKVLLTAVRAVGVEAASIGDPNSDGDREATEDISAVMA